MERYERINGEFDNISDDTFSYKTPYYSRMTSYLNPQTHCLGPSDREEESIQSKWSTPGALNL